jgi:hypothetical protein
VEAGASLLSLAPTDRVSGFEKRPATLSRAYDQKDRYIQSVLRDRTGTMREDASVLNQHNHFMKHFMHLANEGKFRT